MLRQLALQHVALYTVPVSYIEIFTTLQIMEIFRVDIVIAHSVCVCVCVFKFVNKCIADCSGFVLLVNFVTGSHALYISLYNDITYNKTKQKTKQKIIRTLIRLVFLISFLLTQKNDRLTGIAWTKLVIIRNLKNFNLIIEIGNI